jgi:hypothetical protein
MPAGTVAEACSRLACAPSAPRAQTPARLSPPARPSLPVPARLAALAAKLGRRFGAAPRFSAVARDDPANLARDTWQVAGRGPYEEP